MQLVRRAILVACGAVIAGGVAALTATQEAALTAAEVASRRSEQTMAASHELDLAVRAGGRKGVAALEELRQLASSDEHRHALDVVARCLSMPTCTDVGAVLLSAKQQLGQGLADAREHAAAAAGLAATTRMWAPLAIALAALALLMAAWRPAARVRPRPPVVERASDNGRLRALEDALRERLEQLYDARLRARENARFASYGEIAAGLSHGLKTPLASVRAAAQVAQAKLGRDHPARDNLDDVIDEVDALVEQINRFLKTMGSGTPAVEAMSVRDLVAPLDRRYANGDPVRGVTWQLRVADDVADVSVDSELCEMALRNLIDNAFLAAPQGSAVLLAIGPCEPPERAGLEGDAPASALAGRRWVEISVIDQGPGIPREVTRAQEAVSSRPGGSGLGIAIARRIAARHGGAVVLYTEADIGTCASFILPPAIVDTRAEA